jgi:PEP-CTERM motif-containing protein
MRVRSVLFVLLAGISVLVLGLIITATPAQASAVDVGASGADGGDWAFTQSQWLGAEFTLSGTTQINTVSLGIGDGSLTFYTVAIVDSLTGGTVEWTSPSVNTSNPVFTPSSLTLAAGTYFLIGPTTGDGLGWLQSGGILTQTGGTVGSGFWVSGDQGASWLPTSINNSDPLQFDITGTTGGSGVTPEPSSLFLLGTGLLGCAGFLRRKLLA